MVGSMSSLSFMYDINFCIFMILVEIYTMPLRQPVELQHNGVVKTEWCNVNGDIWRVSTHVSGWREWKLGLMNECFFLSKDFVH